MNPLFQIISDIHEEFSDIAITELVNPRADIVILAGDITQGVGIAEISLRVAKSWPEIEFVVVAGNHEFYHKSFDYQDFAECIPLWNKMETNLHFLENSSIVIDTYDLEIFGGIGWSNLRGLNDVNALLLQMRINDFRYITVNNQALTVSTMRELNARFRHACIQTMSASGAEHKIVITHFPQSVLLKHSAYPLDLMATYFCSNDDELIRELANAGVKTMISGHTHQNFDCVVEGVRQVSNQIGYPSEACFSNNVKNAKKLFRLL